ncbi:MAG: hypothetical protein OXE03_07065 [Gammaproteobacteria bacterium]|nr:hypothetical protein [Gammaproteobacteria bacterium]MCY4282657.1 hypothetical protein [Gammaproteobacteria bacterium]
MNTINRYGTVGATPNLQSVHDTTAVKQTRSGQPQVLSADGLSYLKADGKAPVPAFAGPVQVDQDQQGRGALQVMREHVRADVDGLTTAWADPKVNLSDPQGSGFGINYSELIEVLVNLDSEQAKASREAHTEQYRAIAAKEREGAEDIRKAGHLEFVGAMISSSMTIGAGAVQVGGAMYAMGADGGGGAGASAETAGAGVEGATAETGAGSMTEEGGALSAPLGETSMVGEAEGAPDAVSMTSEDAGAETTTELQTEVEEAASNVEAGEAEQTEASADVEDTTVEEEMELTEQQDEETQTRQDKKVLDDDTQKMMRQFSKDARANVSAQSSQARLTAAGGLSQGLTGVGSGAKGVADMGASEYRAKEREDQAAAAEQRASMERERDYGKSAEENAKKMMDIYDAIAQSRNASLERVLSA